MTERRVFSRKTFNGYHLVRWAGIPGDDEPIGFFKKLDSKDAYGFEADENIALCPKPGFYNGPWADVYLYVSSICQKCIWLQQLPDTDYTCALRARTLEGHLVNGSQA